MESYIYHLHSHCNLQLQVKYKYLKYFQMVGINRNPSFLIPFQLFRIGRPFSWHEKIIQTNTQLKVHHNSTSNISPSSTSRVYTSQYKCFPTSGVDFGFSFSPSNKTEPLAHPQEGRIANNSPKWQLYNEPISP